MSSEVPEGWRRASLGDVLRLEYGRALSATVREDGNVPVYGSNGVVGFHSKPLVRRKGIVVGRKGTAGSVTITDGPFWPIDTAYYVEPRQEVDFEWLASILKHARLRDLNESTGVPGLNRDKVYREAALIPPVDEQRRIAEVLRSLDEAVALDGECIANLIGLRDAFLEKNFHRADWEPERPLPSGWTLTLLDAVVTRGSGHTPNKKVSAYWGGEISWVSLQDTKRLDRLYIHETAERITPEGIANSSAVLHPEGTVVLSRDATVGRSAITSSEMAVSQHFMAFRCGPRINNHYLYYWLQRMKPIFERIGAGSTIKTIGLPFFKGLKIAFPPIEAQVAVANEMAELDGLISVHQSIQARSRSLKFAVSDDLLTGRVRVPA